LTLDPDGFALVPVKPLHVVQVGIITPPLKADSRLTTLFKDALREEAKAIEQRLARHLGRPSGGEIRSSRNKPKRKPTGERARRARSG
jgi:hypothetical protein